MLRELLLVVIAASLASGSAFAYVTAIHAPAVLVNQDKGTLTTITLNITPGRGIVTVNNNTVDLSTVQSAETAARYGAKYAGANYTKYNFNYTIYGVGNNVSGPSAGLAFTLLAISGIEHRPLNNFFTETGTINSNGTVGQIGGIYDKIGSANASALSFVLVPYAPNSSLVYLLYYISQQHWRIPVIEVSNVSDAIPYAFGNAKPAWLRYNTTQFSNIASLQNATATCSTCNDAAFGILANYTFNLTQSEINNINQSRYGQVRSQLLGELGQDERIAKKGYIYVAADLSFLQYQEAFVFANSDNFNTANATTVINDASAFCSSILQPQLTDTNYNYVVGGQLRQSWANITIGSSDTVLNASETTDEIIAALYAVAPAYGWCQGAKGMYYIATTLNGTPEDLSGNVVRLASSYYNGATGTSIYAESLQYNDKIGNYGAALYAHEYLRAFGPSVSLNYTKRNVSVVGSETENASMSAFGIWSEQFAREAQFYFDEASITANSSLRAGYLSSAYTTARLSMFIGNANRILSSNFTVALTTGGVSQVDGNAGASYVQYANLANQISQLSKTVTESQNQIIQLYALVIILTLLIAILLVVTLRSAAIRGRTGRSRGAWNS